LLRPSSLRKRGAKGARSARGCLQMDPRVRKGDEELGKRTSYVRHPCGSEEPRAREARAVAFRWTLAFARVTKNWGSVPPTSVILAEARSQGRAKRARLPSDGPSRSQG